MIKNYSRILSRLEKPQGKVDVVIDTDTYNEIDDQFAIVYALKSSEKLNVKALLAAPFLNEKSTSAEDGMNQSYDEIIKLLSIMEKEGMKEKTFRGATSFLEDESTPVESEAVTHLIELAKNYDSENPLYVVAIGAITNIASAILIEPSIIDKIVLIWLGGHGFHWHDNEEFNLKQDISASRIVFDSGVPLVQLPCMGVVSEFRVTKPELEYWFRGKNAISDYLIDATIKEAEEQSDVDTWSRVIWDVVAVAWLLDGDLMNDVVVPSPIPEYDHQYAYDLRRHPIKYVYGINRDNIMQSLVETITKN